MTPGRRRYWVATLLATAAALVWVVATGPPIRTGRAAPPERADQVLADRSGTPVVPDAPTTARDEAPRIVPPEPTEPSAPAAVAPAPEGQAGTLRVRVVDERGTPWSGARVWLTAAAGDARIERETAADGFAHFAGAAAGKWRLRVAAGGVQRITEVQLLAGRDEDVEVVIARDGALLTGVVSHRERGPLAGVEVELARRDDRGREVLSARTGETGAYRIEVVPPGAYRVCVRGDALRDPVVECPGLDVPRAGPIRRDIVLGLPSLAGVVRDAVTGRPLPGVCVRLQKPVDRSCTTGADGTYRLDDVLPGEGKLLLVKDGYELLFVDLGDFVAGEARTRDVLLHPASSLELHVSDGGGRPVAGDLRLCWTSHDDDSSTVTTAATTDGDGIGVYTMIRPGIYDLWARQGELRSEPQTFEIRAGRNTVHFRLGGEAPDGPVALRGRVADAATGRPVRGVRLDAAKRAAYTDASGLYSLRGLPPGKHAVHVSKDGYGALVLRCTVGTGAATVLDVALEPAAILHVRVLDAAGRPVQGSVFLVIRRAGGESPGARLEMDEQGRATYRRIVPGSYEFRTSVRGLGEAHVRADILPGENAIELRLGGR